MMKSPSGLNPISHLQNGWIKREREKMWKEKEEKKK